MKKLFILLFILFISYVVKAEEHNKCLLGSTTEKAKDILEAKKFFVYFCAKCNYKEANIRKINIEEIIIPDKSCNSKLQIKGKIVRGIKPPVFGGYCTPKLEVSNKSFELDLAFDNEVDLKNIYVWDKSNNAFVNLLKIMELGDQDTVCVENIVLTK